MTFVINEGWGVHGLSETFVAQKQL